jgi:hypothetical protein
MHRKLRQWIANRADNWGDLRLAPFWQIRRFALAFRKLRDYLADLPRHCESKVRLAPPGTGA